MARKRTITYQIQHKNKAVFNQTVDAITTTSVQNGQIFFNQDHLINFAMIRVFNEMLVENFNTIVYVNHYYTTLPNPIYKISLPTLGSTLKL